MTFAVFKNRNGKLIVEKRLLTDDVMQILSAFDHFNDSISDQDDLVSVIADILDELADECTMEDFNLCAAIFVNAKNYVIHDEDELLEALQGLEVAIGNNRGTWQPEQALGSILCFVENGVAEDF